MYDKITNPLTGRKVNIGSKLGIQILKSYIRVQLGGHTGPCAMGDKGRCKKSDLPDGNCELSPKGRCRKVAKKPETKENEVPHVENDDYEIPEDDYSLDDHFSEAERVEDVAKVFIINKNIEPYESKMSKYLDSIYAIDPDQLDGQHKKILTGAECFNPKWKDNGKDLEYDEECNNGEYIWEDKENGLAKCGDRLINCIDETEANEKHHLHFKEEAKKRQQHFREQIREDLERIVNDGGREGDLVENIAISGYRSAGVYVLKNDNNGDLQISEIDTAADDYGHVGDGFSLGEQFPVGYWERAEFHKASWHGEPHMEPVHKDLLLGLKLHDFDEEEYEDYDGVRKLRSVAWFEWGALIFPVKKKVVLEIISQIEFINDRAYFQEIRRGMAQIIDWMITYNEQDTIQE